MRRLRPISSAGQRTRRPLGRSIASIRHLPNGVMLQVDAGYNKAFTETLKKSIAAKHRLWDKNDKCWYVVKSQFDRLCLIMEEYFDEVQLIDFPAHEVAADAWSRLYLIPNAPLEIVRAAYKTLAQKYHPDKGGDVEAMQKINAAYKEILGELANGEERS